MSNEGFFVNFWVSLIRDNKLSYIGTNKIQNVLFDHIIPDKRNDWVHQSDNDFDDLLPLIDKEVKRETSQKAVFKLFSSGLKTQRDEWVYDFSRETLDSKVKFLIDVYQKTLQDNDYVDKDSIKWDADLKQYLKRNINKNFDKNSLIKTLYRPYIYKSLYVDKHFNGRTYQWFNIYRSFNDNY